MALSVFKMDVTGVGPSIGGVVALALQHSPIYKVARMSTVWMADEADSVFLSPTLELYCASEDGNDSQECEVTSAIISYYLKQWLRENCAAAAWPQEKNAQLGWRVFVDHTHKEHPPSLICRVQPVWCAAGTWSASSRIQLEGSL